MSENTETRSLAAPLRAGIGTGIEIDSFEGMQRFALMLAKSDLIPRELRGNPANCCLVLTQGLELGLPPMAALNNIAVINGRPCVWGDSALAVVQSHPDYLDIDEEIQGDGDNMVAVCKVYKKSRGMDRPVVRTYSVQDAKCAGLWGKGGPWSQHPKRMLQMRARSYGIRDAFPGALRGMITAEESADIPSPHRHVVPDSISAQAEVVSPPDDSSGEITAETQSYVVHPDVAAAFDRANTSETKRKAVLAGARQNGWTVEQTVAAITGSRAAALAPPPPPPPAPATPAPAATDEVLF